MSATTPRYEAAAPGVPRGSAARARPQRRRTVSRRPRAASNARVFLDGRRPTPVSRNPLQRLIDRAERVDWRYKLQLTVAFCIAIIVPMYLLRERIAALGEWGYLGAFIINAISSATIILPAPGGAVIAIMAQKFNPVLIGICAGIGGTIGGASAYVVGAVNASSARGSRWFRWIERPMARFGALIIFLFALIPVLPGDLASITAGAVRYPLRKYFLYNGIGSVIKMSVMAWLGADALVWLEQVALEWARSLF